MIRVIPRSSKPAPAPEMTVNFGDEVQQYYRALLRRLGWPASEHAAPPQTLGMTSCTSGEGVTTVAVQLAATAAAQPGQRVLLVDAHLERPAAARMLGVASERGFADAVLSGNRDDLEIQATPIRNLSLLSAGSVRGSCDAAYDSPALSGLVEDLKTEFDLVVFDLPPCGANHAPLRLAELMDAVLLVVEAQRARQGDVRRVHQLLSQAHVRLAGAVLNRQRNP